MIEEKFQTIDINLILGKMPLSPNSRIADLGCGNFGYFLFPLSRLVGAQGKVYAVDVVTSHLDEVRRRARSENFSNIEIVLANIENIGNKTALEGGLDGVMLVNTLHQSEKRKEILVEAARLLKPGAWMMIIERNSSDSNIGLSVDRRISQEVLLEAGKKLGLSLSEIFQPGSHYYGLLFFKK